MIFKIILSLLLIIGGLSSIADIGKERKPLKPSIVIVSLIIDMLIVLGLWLLI